MNTLDKNSATSGKGRPVYLDYQASTPVDPRVVDAMAPFFGEKFGNPHSSGHFYGWEAGEAVEVARENVARLIGATAREIVFTSGATESNNLAIKGIARFHKDQRNHIVTLATEHKCVLESSIGLEREGFKVSVLPVMENGLLDLDRLRDVVTENTSLVSVMAVNNEIGVIQPLAEIAAICRDKGAFFHSDAAQAAGRIPFDVEELSVDLASLSGHKVYGPMGIGVLYVRRRPRVRLEPLFSGGGQEQGLRSGTLAPPLCVGLGEAAVIAAQESTDEAERLSTLRDRFLEKILINIPDAKINGDVISRIPGNLNFTFPGVMAQDLMAGLKDLAISTGSACNSASVEPSYVLKALGLSDEDSFASVRIGFGRFTTEREIDFATDKIADEVDRIRRGSLQQSMHATPAA
ncbi:MAG: aminotransferase class V-fold PLP-dependent enzyme [Proteobacteria bacterium]|nr:aminotransferase class V-fold PLP-dependent enzyme [Pseudomonadota bacterium]MDA1022417.1 aminotransferase class V-fold PLP-dependent enzyme [Pseudomonadota bacterium]